MRLLRILNVFVYSNIASRVFKKNTCFIHIMLHMYFVDISLLYNITTDSHFAYHTGWSEVSHG